MTIQPTFSVPFKTYEELAGASGRHMYFRAPRSRARELFDHDIPLADIGGVPCHLADISLSGIAATHDNDNAEALTVGRVVPVEIRHFGQSLFSGQGEIVRTEQTFRGQKVGIRFVQSSADLERIRTLYAEEVIRQELNETPASAGNAVEAAYRVLCTEVLEFVAEYRRNLTRIEKLDPKLATDVQAQRRVLTLCDAKALPQFFQFIERGNALIEAAGHDQKTLTAMKDLTVNVVTPNFLGGPGWWHSFMKPLGYPGDFMLMNYVYDGGDYGETLFDKFLHRLGLCSSHFIHTRMEYMRAQIAALLSQRGARGTRILSLASGPAEELSSLVRQSTDLPPVDITLIDQDSRALSFAYEGIYPVLTSRFSGSSIRCLHASFTRLLKGSNLLGEPQHYDLVYSVGLVDYLKARRAKVLLEGMFEQVAPGGTLIIGNMRQSATTCRWVTDMVCEWELIYRDEQEMLALADELDAASRSVTIDKTGQCYFLTVKKG